MLKLDKTDKKILTILQEDARITTKELSEKIHLSSTPVYERVKKLERNGVIEKYTAVLNREKIGKGTTVFLMISLSSHAKDIVDSFRKQVMSFPEVMEFYYISGNYDSLIKIMIGDMNEFKAFIEEKLSKVENLTQFHSIFAISGSEKSGFEF